MHDEGVAWLQKCVDSKAWILRKNFVEKGFWDISFFRKKSHRKKIEKKGTFTDSASSHFSLRKSSVLYDLGISINGKRTHQWVPLWMIYFFKILLWTPKEVTKMTLKNDNSNLPYLLPSWQNILFIDLYFFRFSFVFRRKKASDFSFFEKTEFPTKMKSLVRTYFL